MTGVAEKMTQVYFVGAGFILRKKYDCDQMTELLCTTRSEVRDFVDVSHVQVNTATMNK